MDKKARRLCLHAAHALLALLGELRAPLARVRELGPALCLTRFTQQPVSGAHKIAVQHTEVNLQSVDGSRHRRAPSFTHVEHRRALFLQGGRLALDVGNEAKPAHGGIASDHFSMHHSHSAVTRRPEVRLH